MNPPRLPIKLINPIEAAAADSPRARLGNTQKGGGNAYPAAVVRQSKVRTMGKFQPGQVLRAKNAAHSIKGMAA